MMQCPEKKYYTCRVGRPALVAQGVSTLCTRHLLEALLPQGGIERVSKIVMCIGTKLCYRLQKLQIS